MAYITDANARRIINKTDLKSVNINGLIFQKDIYCFSDFEQIQLLAYKELVKDVDRFIQKTYKPIELKKDSFSWVYEYDEEKPAFHKTLECSYLNKDYKNFSIPDEIKSKDNGQLDFEKIQEFRNWFPTVQHLFENDKQAFVYRLKQKWGIVTNPAALEASNTGSQEFVNYDINQIIDKINTLIKQAGRYYYSNSKNTIILRRFSKYTFLAYKDEKLKINDTGFPDNEVKIFLKKYDELIKRPLKKLLKDYYRIQYNPDLDFESELLKTLNFKPCSKCYKVGVSTKEDIDLLRGQFNLNERRSNYSNEDDFTKEYLNSFDKLRNDYTCFSFDLPANKF